MNKQQAQEIAIKLFAIHSRIDKVYITTDGQSFSDLDRAESHARTLKDDSVFDFDRYTAPQEDATKVETDKEREELIAEYAELFEKQPAHNIGTETLRQKIADKKAELEAETTNLTGGDIVTGTTVLEDKKETTDTTVDNKEDVNNEQKTQNNGERN